MKIEKKPTKRDLDRFREYCVSHFGEVENDTLDKVYDRFCEEDQGEEVGYI